ncbi:MAG: DNA repair protein RecO C-terminal domain-containing protein [Chloroflexi bacterium]|nr:DNA repair protein RecO C-terminal domain-containing protein [Chloroflexota bacterium]
MRWPYPFRDTKQLPSLRLVPRPRAPGRLCAWRGEAIRAEDQFFSAAAGGAVCPACGPDTPSALPISLAALKLLRHLQRSSYPEAIVVQVRPAVHAEMEAVMQRYATYLLERRLKSVEFLRMVRQQG